MVNAAPPCGTITGGDVAAVCRGDPFDDRQPQAGSATLGREERFEQPLIARVGDARPAVGDFQFDAAGTGECR